MTNLLWGVYPYVAFTLFFSVPVIRMVFRPYSITTRASGLFNKRIQGVAMHLFHWGIFLVLLGHIAGFIGAALFVDALVDPIFYWSALIGGLMTLAGSVISLARRFVVPEVRAMSQFDDYSVHFFLIAILGIALYQVLVQQTFGIAYAMAPWFASIWAFAPQPDMMEGATLLTQISRLPGADVLCLLPVHQTGALLDAADQLLRAALSIDAHQSQPLTEPVGICAAQRQVLPHIHGLGDPHRRDRPVDVHRVRTGIGAEASRTEKQDARYSRCHQRRPISRHRLQHIVVHGVLRSVDDLFDHRRTH